MDYAKALQQVVECKELARMAVIPPQAREKINLMAVTASMAISKLQEKENYERERESEINLANQRWEDYPKELLVERLTVISTELGRQVITRAQDLDNVLNEPNADTDEGAMKQAKREEDAIQALLDALRKFWNTDRTQSPENEEETPDPAQEMEDLHDPYDSADSNDASE